MSGSIPPDVPNTPLNYTLSPTPRTNGFAIASFIVGLIGCVPLLSGILAVIFGILGVRTSSRPGYGLKGLAIAGIVLGVLGILGWSAFGGGMYLIFRASGQPRTVAKQFAHDLAAGNGSAALTKSSGISRATIDGEIAKLKGKGAILDITLADMKVNTTNGRVTWHFVGTITFKSGTVPYDVELLKHGNTHLVSKFTIGP